MMEITLSEPLTKTVPYPSGDPLTFERHADGTINRVNDPERFAATPQVLAYGGLHVSLRILDRTYRIEGLTEHGDFVLSRCED